MLVVIIIALLLGGFLTWRIEAMRDELERLRSEVSEATSAVDSAVALIEGLATQIRENIGNAGALTALADSLDSSSNKLAAAVAANTDAEDDVTDDTALEPITDAEVTEPES